jgi:hypothetical protein
MCRKEIKLLSEIAYSVFALKASWVVSVWVMDLPHCLSVTLRGQRLYKITPLIKSGNYPDNFM